MAACLFCNTFEFNLWHITHISHIKYIFNFYYSVTAVYSVLIVFNDSVLSLPSTIQALCSVILYTGMEAYGYCSKH